MRPIGKVRLIGIKRTSSFDVFNSGKQGTTVHTVMRFPIFRYAKTVQTACWGAENERFDRLAHSVRQDAQPPKSRPTSQKYVARTFTTERIRYALTRMKSGAFAWQYKVLYGLLSCFFTIWAIKNSLPTFYSTIGSTKETFS